MQSQKTQKTHSGDFSEGESDSDSQLLSFASYHYKGRSIYEDSPREVGGELSCAMSGELSRVEGGELSREVGGESSRITDENPSSSTNANSSQSSPAIEAALKRFPYNVYFKTENFLTEPHFFSQYDTITW